MEPNTQSTESQGMSSGAPTNADMAAPQAAPAAPASSGMPAAEASDLNIMAILAYLGPLAFVPFLTARDDAFAYYHAKQGLALFGIVVVWWVLSAMLTMTMMFWGVFFLINNVVMLGSIVLGIIGIVHVVQKKMVPLPLIGSFVK